MALRSWYQIRARAGKWRNERVRQRGTRDEGAQEANSSNHAAPSEAACFLAIMKTMDERSTAEANASSNVGRVTAKRVLPSNTSTVAEPSAGFEALGGNPANYS